jgi:hypothetical protein
MHKTTRFLPLLLILIALLAACGGSGGTSVAEVPTNTLRPILSQTARLTATPFASLTPLPTRTSTPTTTLTPRPPTQTPTATATPLITGIVRGTTSINVRSGPGTENAVVAVLNGGDGVTLLQPPATDDDWFNVETGDGEQGFVASNLIRVNPTPTGIPTFAPTLDLTSVALGTVYPTALFGGGVITPTPPSAVRTETPGAAVVAPPAGTLSPLQLTSTALASGGAITTPRPSATADLSLPGLPTGAPGSPVATITPGGPLPTGTPSSGGAAPVTPPGSSSTASAATSNDVFAMCSTLPRQGSAPRNLRAGTTIDIYWGWFASTREQVEQHTAAASYEVRITGRETPLEWRQYGFPIREEGGQFVRYWFVPYGPLAAGTYTITYRVTWTQQIFDGSNTYGPGAIDREEGSCTFTVAP